MSTSARPVLRAAGHVLALVVVIALGSWAGARTWRRRLGA